MVTVVYIYTFKSEKEGENEKSITRARDDLQSSFHDRDLFTGAAGVFIPFPHMFIYFIYVYIYR